MSINIDELDALLEAPFQQKQEYLNKVTVNYINFYLG